MWKKREKTLKREKRRGSKQENTEPTVEKKSPAMTRDDQEGKSIFACSHVTTVVGIRATADQSTPQETKSTKKKGRRADLRFSNAEIRITQRQTV